jgi:hypothetical protein
MPPPPGLPEGASQTQALIATAHAAAGRHEEALRAWQEYLEAFDDPAGLALAQFNRGCSLAALGRHAEAAQAFARAADPGTGESCVTQARMAQAKSLLLSQSNPAAREIFLELASASARGRAAAAGRASRPRYAWRGWAPSRQAIAEFDALAAERPGRRRGGSGDAAVGHPARTARTVGRGHCRVEKILRPGPRDARRRRCGRPSRPAALPQGGLPRRPRGIPAAPRRGRSRPSSPSSWKHGRCT